MNRSIIGFILLPMILGCTDCLVCQDPGPNGSLSRLTHDDSAAIITMKKSLGVWNGSVMDWVGSTADSQATSLYFSNPNGKDVIFPSKGLEKVSRIFIHCAQDSAYNIQGMERLGNLVYFGTAGENGVYLNAWPRGIFKTKSIRNMDIGGTFSSVPDSITELGLLSFLNLGGVFTKVPKAFLQMPALDTVVFSDGKFCSPSDSEITWLNTHFPTWKNQNCSMH